MKNVFEKLKIDVYGESHSDNIGVIVQGFPSGEEIDANLLNKFMERRKSSNSAWSTKRFENDEINFLSGIKDDKNKFTLTGDVLEAQIENNNVINQDYYNLFYCPRPSHADFVAYMRDGEIKSGGGRFSGRMTAPICVAGGIALQILNKRGINIACCISQIGEVFVGSYKNGDKIEMSALNNCQLPLIKSDLAQKVTDEILQAQKQGDSLGGIIECQISGVKAGELGDNLFEGLEGKISYAVFGVPAVKAIEFGAGFDLAKMQGSQANDSFVYDDDKVVTKTNNSGGINGGISNGMPIQFRVAIRPTPSISKPQDTVNLKNAENVILEIRGRHDACIVPRAVPCIEAVVALAVLDELMVREN